MFLLTNLGSFFRYIKVIHIHRVVLDLEKPLELALNNLEAYGFSVIQDITLEVFLNKEPPDEYE